MLDTKDINFDLIVGENPEVGKYLSLMWGKPEFVYYIHSLLIEPPAAANFSPAMSMALTAIASKHTVQYATLYK